MLAQRQRPVGSEPVGAAARRRVQGGHALPALLRWGVSQRQSVPAATILTTKHRPIAAANRLHYTTDLTPHAAVDPKLKLTPLGVERVGVYRFLDAEIVAFEDGGKLVWRNNDPGPSPKCRCEEPAKPPQPSPPVMLRTYVWAYQWPMANRSADGGGSVGGGGQSD